MHKIVILKIIHHKKNLMNIPKVSTPQIEEEKTKITLIKKVICT